MDKEDALRIIVKCAKLYNDNLKNKNVLFISQINKDRINLIECSFKKGNFMHLTGIHSNNISANLFYEKCINNQLSLDDFELKDDGTTYMKLSVLPMLTEIHKIAKMIGDLNVNKSKLCVEKLTGGISACIGLVRKGKYYIPVSALKVDMREIVYKQERIIAIFTKLAGNNLYNCITYSADKVDISEECMEQVLQLIDLDNLKYDFAEGSILSNSVAKILYEIFKEKDIV